MWKLIEKIIASTLILIVFFTIPGLFPALEVFSFAPQIAQAAFNKQINYQGKLTTPLNVAAADGVYHMRFALYTSPTGGSPVWQEDRSTAAGDRVTLSNGLFSVMLGSSTPLTSVNFDQTLYLGVEVGGSSGSPTWDGEMTPRKVLGAVPAAFVADTLDNLDSTQFVRTDTTSTIATSSVGTALTINQSGAGDIFTLQSGGNPVFTVQSSTGNVGIGTTTPYEKLSVVGNIIADGLVRASSFVGTSTATSTLGGGLDIASGCFAVGGTCLTQGLTSAITAIGPTGQTQTGGVQTLATSTAGTDFTITASADTQTFNFPFASASANGKLSSFDWTVFNNKVSSSSLSGASVISYNAGTGVITTLGGTFGTGNYVFPNDVTITGNSTTTNATSTNIFATNLTAGNFRLSGVGANMSVATDGSGNLVSTSTPQFANVTATSTTGTSTFAGGLAVGTSNFVVDRNTGNVGIGSTTPSTKLSVTGNGYFTGGLGVGVVNTSAGTLRTSGAATIGGNLALSSLLNCNSSSQAIQSDGSGILSCGTITGGGASVGGGWASLAPNIVRLATTTDLVGVGTTSPYAKLSVSSGSTSTTTLAVAAVSGQTANVIDIYNNLGIVADVFTSMGDLGLGSTTPSEKLAVNGNVAVDGFVRASTFIATSTTAESLFSGFIASNSTTTQATTTSLAISSITSSLLKTNSNGSVLAAVAGTDYENALTFGTGLSRTLNAVSCNTASATTFGCLATTDWSIFNNKISSTSLDTSSKLASLITDETGSGSLVFGTLPTLQGFISNASSTIYALTATTATTTSATSTNLFATNLFATNFRLSGVGTTMLLGTDASGNVVSTSTPAVAAINATSSTATSTFAGGLSVAGSSGLTVLQNGNVGIGVVNPTSALQLSASGVIYAPSGNTQTIGLTTFGNSDRLRTVTNTGLFTVENSGNAYLTGGNMGIGTTSPYAKLSVVGQVVGANFTATTSALNTFPQLAFTSATGTSATTTNFFATNLSFTTITGGNFTSTGLVTANNFLANASSTFQNFTASNSTSTNATTTNFFSTTASSTNLYGTNANLGNLTVGNSTTTNATTTTFAVTGTATSTFTNGIALSGGCFSMNGSCLGQQTSWSALADPIGSLSLNMGTNSTNFNWTTGTGASDLFALTTNNSANGVGNLLLLQTGVGSTVKPLRVLAGNTDALAVDASGNVGVGTTSPYAKLAVAGDIAADGFVRASSFTATSTTADSVFSRLSFTSATGTSATTTNFFATNLTAGNLRLSGIGSTMLLSTDGSGNIVSSSTPQVASLNATSTTATSTFSGGLAVNKGTNPSFTVDRSTGFVGVGTGSSTSAFTAIDLSASTGRPGSLFEVRNAIAGANYVVARFSVVGPGSQSPGIALASNGSDIFNITNNVTGTGVTRFDALAGSMSFAFNSVEAIRFNSNGNVGIGTTSPYAKLSVAGEVVGANFTATSTTATSTFAGALSVGSSTPAGNSLFSVGTSTPLFIIDRNTANIGVATATPATNLSVGGSGYFTGGLGVGALNTTAGTIQSTGNISVGVGAQLRTNNISALGGASTIDVAGNALIIGANSSYLGGITFLPGSAQKMILTQAGRLGLGTSTPNNALAEFATSTAPQLSLMDNSTNTTDKWTFRNAGGNLYLATSSASTFATSSVSAFSISNNGIPSFPSLGGVTGCAQLSSTGALSNTGTTCVTSAITAIGPAGQTQTGATQTLATSTTGTDFTITASGNTQTFNLPFSSATANGKLSSTDWSIFNNKISSTSLDTSSKLASLITDETGSGSLVFGTLPTLQGFISNASSTIYALTATNGTTTNATSTNLSATNFVATNATTTTFAVTGTATSTFTNGIALSGGCFSMNGSCLGQQTSWSALADPIGSLSLNMGTNSTNFNWTTGTGASDLFALTTNNSANGVGNLLLLQTGVGSTVKPLRVLAGNTDALAVDASGNVGVGTTTPGSKLVVSGGLTVGSNTYATAPTNGLLVEGNVGIGTTSPYAKLSVVGEVVGSYFTGTSTATSSFYNLTTTGTATSTFNRGISLNGGCFAVAGTCLTQGLTSAITAIGPAGQTQTGATQTLATSTTGTDFTITASGNTQTFNLPFSSATANGKLSSTDWSIFNNKISSSSLSGASVISYNSSTGVITTTPGAFAGSAAYSFPANVTASVGTNSAVSYGLTNQPSTGINFPSPGNISFVLTGTEYARLASGGNFGLGTTSPLAKLDVAGVNNATTALFQLSSVASFATTTRFSISNSGDMFVSGSTTLQNFTAVNATTTSATSTNLFATTASSTNLFYTTGKGGNETLTGTLTANNILANASSTLQNFTALNSTSTNATTTSLAISSITSSLLKTNSNGSVLAAVAGTDYENALTFGTGLSRTLNAVSCNTASATTFGCLATTDWSIFNNKISSTSLDTSSKLASLITDETGSGSLVFGTLPTLQGFISNASSTIYALTATTATTTSATSTNLFATNLFATNFRLSGVGTTMLLGTDASGNVVSTSTPAVAAINATSSTATSTFAGGLSVAGSSGLTVLQNGNVGVATTSPYAALSVVGKNSALGNADVAFAVKGGTGTNTGGPIQLMAGDGGNNGGSLLFTSGNGDSFGGDITVTAGDGLTNGTGGNIKINPGAKNGAGQDGNIILANLRGNVGIGTTSPYAKLSVVGEVVGSYFTGTSTATSSFYNLTTTGTATSTFNRGISLNGGCFAVAGTCLTQGLTSAITAIGPAGQTQTGATQTLATSTTGTDFTITASGNTQTFNLPFSSATANGKLSSTDWSIFNNKISSTSLDTSSKLASLITDETGSGSLVFGTLPTLQGFISNASSTIYALTATNGTTTNATSTNLSVGTLFRSGTTDGCATWSAGILGSVGVACGSGSGSTYPFALTGNATSTLTQFNGGLTADASSTITALTVTSGTTTNATTTSLAISSITSSLLKTNSNGSVLAAVAGTDYENALTFGTGLSRTLNAVSCNTASATTFGCLATTDWSIFNNKISSTSLDTSSKLASLITDETGSGSLVFGTLPTLQGFISNASSTIYALTATNGTTTNATSTNFFATNFTLSGVGTTMLLGTDASGNVVSTSTPAVAAINATSSTATSTFAGGMSIGGSTGLTVVQGGGQIQIGAGTPPLTAKLQVSSTGGTGDLGLIINATGATGEGGFLFSRAGTFTGEIGVAGAANQVLNGSATNDLAFKSRSGSILFGGTIGDIERMRITNSGNVGIGTSTPSFLLNIASSTASQLALSDGTATSNAWTMRSVGNFFYLATSSPSTFATSTNSALTIDLNGNFGIASTTPSQKLSVTGNGYFTGGLGVGTGNTVAGSIITTGNITLLNSASVRANIFASAGGNAAIDVQGTTLVIGTTNTYTSGISFLPGSTQKMILTPAGRLGLGTSTPNNALAEFATSTAPQLSLMDNTSNTIDKWTFRNAGGNLYFATSSAGTFATSTVSAFSIMNSTGNIGVGTSSPYTRFAVQGEAAASYFTAYSTATSTFNGPILVSTIATNNSGTAGLIIGSTSTPQILGFDTINNRTQVGLGTGTAAPVLFVLDTKNTSGDPTGTNGAMYYNSNSSQFRCFLNSAWSSCGSIQTISTSTNATSTNFFATSGSFTSLLLGSSTPTIDGQLGYDPSRGTITQYSATTSVGNIPRVLSITRPGTSLTNSTASDQDYSSVYTIPANALIANKMYRVSLTFQSVTAVSTATLALYLKLGSTKVFNAAASNITDNTTRSFTYVFNIMGTAAPSGSASVEVGGPVGTLNGGSVSNMNNVSQPVAGFATNATITVVPGVTWSATGSTDTLQLLSAVVEEIN